MEDQQMAFGDLERMKMTVRHLYDAFHEARVKVEDERTQKSHLFARVLKDDARIIRLAAQTIGCHDHGQVVDIHLSHCCIFSGRKHLSHQPIIQHH